MRRYSSAYGKTSSGVRSSFSSSGASTSPRRVTATPSSSAVRIEVCVARRTVSRSPRPMALAMTTLTPSEIPTNRLTNRPMIALFVPTAATDTLRSSPVKLPTIATSEALNSWDSTAVTATGSAKRGSLFQIEPFNMSISLFLLTVSMMFPFAAACRILLYRIPRQKASVIFTVFCIFGSRFSAVRAPRAAARRQNTTACRKIHAKQKKCAILIAARGECDEV